MTLREWTRRVTTARLLVVLAAIAVASGITSLSWQIYSKFLTAPEIIDCYLEASFVDPEWQHFDLYLVVRNMGVKDVFLRHVLFDGETLCKSTDPLLQEPIRPGEEWRINVGSYSDREIEEWINRMDRLAEDMRTYVETTRDKIIYVDMKMAQINLDLVVMLRDLTGLSETIQKAGTDKDE